MSHTPGPWKIEKSESKEELWGWFMFVGPAILDADEYEEPQWAKVEADARLIQEAPALKAWLLKALRYMPSAPLYDEGRAILVRIEGEAK